MGVAQQLSYGGTRLCQAAVVAGEVAGSWSQAGQCRARGAPSCARRQCRSQAAETRSESGLTPKQTFARLLLQCATLGRLRQALRTITFISRVATGAWSTEVLSPIDDAHPSPSPGIASCRLRWRAEIRAPMCSSIIRSTSPGTCATPRSFPPGRRQSTHRSERSAAPARWP